MKLLAVALCVAVLALGLGELAYRYDQLPDQIASHFGVQGQPDGWTSRTQYVVIMGCLLIGLPAFLMFCFASIRWMPKSLINLPNKEVWLSAENKEQTSRAIIDRGWWMVAATLAFLVTLNHQVLTANLNPPIQLTSMWWLLGSYLVFMAFWTVEFVWRFRSSAAPKGV